MAGRRWIPGAQVGELVLREKIGQGAMGAVFRAEHPTTRGQYAVKAMSLEATPLAVERFRREGQAQAAVDDHPNVLRVRSTGEAYGSLYLVMDLAGGGDLLARLRVGPMDPQPAAALVAKLARGIAHVHRKGILHRDLKPSNVLFDADDVPKLVDFGIARLASEQALTQTGDMVGTPAYMAPEQIDGRRELIDERADVYGLGAILYHCLTGHPPFEGENATNIITKLATEPPRRPRDLRADIPADLEGICLEAMARHAYERYPTAAALAADLERFTRGEPLGRLPRRDAGRRVALGVGALVVTALVVATLTLSGVTPDSTQSTNSGDGASAALDGPPPRLRLSERPPARTTAADLTLVVTLGGTAVSRADAVELIFGLAGATPATLRVPTVERKVELDVPLQVGENHVALSPLRGDVAGDATRFTVARVAAPPGFVLGEAPGEFVNEADGSVLVRIEPGSFRMGWDGRPPARPDPNQPAQFFDGPYCTPHTVTLTRAYFLGETEVTFRQYDAFCVATGRPRVDRREGEFVASDEHPVWRVSWEEARAYCAWAGLRLPSEAEWELAARGPESRPFPWGTQDIIGPGPDGTPAAIDPLTGNFSPAIPGYEDGFAHTAPVGSFPAGATPEGLLDMAGNVCEWVLDAHRPYPAAAQTDPVVLGGPTENRVARGGDYDRGAHQARAYTRRSWGPTATSLRDVGFRVARDAE